jgi:tetratricopeptide (TPR) repeat protein
MTGDVGRNDPCPCGSGAKYKHCCLRKRKHQRGGQKKTDSDAWKKKFNRLLKQGRLDLEQLAKAWALVEKRLEPGDTSPRAVEERLGFPEAETLRNVLEMLAVRSVDVASSGEADPSDIVERLESLLDQFPDMQEGLAGWINQLRVEALTHASRYDEALEGAQQLIDREPNGAVGYVLAADALERDPDRDVDEAVEYLEEASTKDDAQNWDVELRLKHLIGDDADPDEDSAEGGPFEGWESFWEGFREAEVDDAFDMFEARARGDEAFNDAWIREGLIDGFERTVDSPQRAQRWRELVDLVRDEHPHDVDMLDPDLVSQELEAAVRFDMDLEAPLDRLFEIAEDAVFNVGTFVPRLIYAGRPQGLTRRLRQTADDVELAPTALARPLDVWPRCAAMSYLAERAGEDLDTPLKPGELADALGPLEDEASDTLLDEVTRAGTAFFGEFNRPDPAAEDPDTFDTIGLRFGRAVLESGGLYSAWSAPKAAYAALCLQRLIDDQLETPPKKRATYGHLSSRKASQICGRLDGASPLAVDPELAVEAVYRAEPMEELGVCYASAMAAQMLVEWMHFLGDYDLGVSKTVRASTALQFRKALPQPGHFKRFSEQQIVDELTRSFDSLNSI